MYHYEARVSYSEADSKGYAPAGAISVYFQNASNYQAEDLGVGLEYTSSHHHGWVVTYNEIVFYGFPKSGERVNVYTWPYGMNGYMANRHYMLKSAADEVLAVSDSLWVYMDLEKNRLSKIPEEITQAYEGHWGEKYEMGTHGRKIAIPDTLEKQMSFPIRRMDVDTNGHVNNTVYFYLVTELLPEDAVLKRLRMSFVNPSFFGDELTACKAPSEEGLFVVLKNNKGDVCVAAEMIFK